MTNSRSRQQVSLEAKSPFELRVNLGKNVPESDVRAALAQGIWAFFIRSPPAPRWTGRAFAWLRGRPAACGAANTVTTRTPGP